MKRRQRNEPKPSAVSAASRTLERAVSTSRAAGVEPASRFACADASFDQLLRQVARVQPEGAANARVLPKTGSIVEGGYRIERLVATGGMGAIFSATHVTTGMRYALKWIRPTIAHEPDVLQRFERECRAGLSIRHVNVVQTFGVGQSAGMPFLVLEWVQGPSLQKRLLAGAMPLPEALGLLLAITRGVAATHRAGFLHRDLKPDNVLLARGPAGAPRPKIVDFGLAKPLSVNDEFAAITRRDVVLGTPAFTAPEQLLGDAVDERADIYSLGVMLYTMLAGRRPFEATGYNQLLFKIATEEATPLSQLCPAVSPKLEAMVARAMSRTREHRFGSVTEFANALRPFHDLPRFNPFARAG